ncbi:MAG: GNAT family N-acetyltransferase [Candidatus Marinimicrobia bacterium]|nr:GNAT family N-acetyltransferase [Candidatus Neomarinimicrobiota bacterium]
MDSIRKSNILNATRDDIPAITTLLKEANLPPDDLERWIDNFFVLTIEGKIEGCIGLEHWENDGLLRSFVVSEDYRSKGFGIELYNKFISVAKVMNLSSILLLAKGVSDFFEKNGFKFIDRNEVPESVKNSIQFKLEECRVYNVMKLELN